MGWRARVGDREEGVPSNVREHVDGERDDVVSLTTTILGISCVSTP